MLLKNFSLEKDGLFKMVANWGSPIKRVRKFFQKTNISYPWYAYVRVWSGGKKY